VSSIAAILAWPTMLSISHILVATDFCRMSLDSLRYALGIALRDHSSVSLLHVIDPAVYGLAGPDGIAAGYEKAECELDCIEASLRRNGSLEGLKFDSMVRTGPVWPTIAGVIDETRSALLVIGTRGRTGLGKLVLGSVAESAFRESPCPVLTVGPNVLQSKASGSDPKNFLVPTDLSAESLSALPYGVSLAKATGGDLTLLHVLPSRSASNKDTVKAVSEMETRLRAFLQLHPGTAKMAHFRVEAGPAAEVIVKVAERSQMDLIVMGKRAWTTAGPPMWQTAYNVVTQASCPVVSINAIEALDPDVLIQAYA